MSHTIPSSPIDFGVQSYCFRAFKDNPDVAAMVRSIDLNKIELCAVHADFSDPVAFADVVEVYRSAGVEIVSLGVQTFTGDDSERAWFECAAAAGAKHISAHLRVDTFQAAIPKVRRWSREFGIRVGLHCHGGYMFGGSPDVIKHLIALGGPEIGLCIDTAWAMQIGPHCGNPVEWVKQFAGSLYGIHFKDFVFEPNAAWKDVVVGTGNLDLPAFAQALVEANFNGMAVIEYEADVDDPVPALKRCVESMRKSLNT
jgi:sugar phosphate isomerase/epimerase